MRKSLRNLLFGLILAVALSAHFVISYTPPLISVFSTTVASQKKAIRIILQNEKTSEDMSYIKKFLAINQKQMNRLALFIRNLSGVLPLSNLANLADSFASISLQLPRLLGDGSGAEIVVLFLNNYELRPGGGFIGSLGFITLKDYSVTRFEVQDVYEIDGQIVNHYEPHRAVRQYLNQPNEFLRDSNFSPDFSVDAKKTLQHLSNVSSYDRPYVIVIGITASAFEELLKLTGPIELTDYGTTITSSNFFRTTQKKIENEFFPGSKQKRTILQSLGNIMKQKIEELSPFAIFNYIQQSTSTKNLVFFSPSRQLQTFFTLLRVSGTQDSTFSNWIMPVDANVGVNKMDALVYKTMELHLARKNTYLTYGFKSRYTNTITADALEKDSYKNYFQLYVPADAVFKSALINGNDVSSQIITTKEGRNNVYAIYFETPPASSTTISITYDLPYSLDTQQLLFQKQIGSKSSSLTVFRSGETTSVEQMVLEGDKVLNSY